jgi:hypothetical protein
MENNRYTIVDVETGKFLRRNTLYDYRDGSLDFSYHFSYVPVTYALDEATALKKHYDIHGGGTKIIIKKVEE